jgi:SLT domain-containing protein
MDTLITRESGWNSAAINMTDSNAAAGHPSKGLAQTIDSTFAAHAVPGHTNIWEPVDNIAASVNYIKGRYGDISNVQQANANMPARGYAGGTNSAAPGLAVVGEKGPEIVNFKGGEEVLPLTSASAQAAGQNFAKASISQAASDLHIDTSGSGFIPQLFTQSFSYGQQLASYAAQKPGVGYDPQPGVTPANPGQSGPTDVHFHTNGVDEALKKWRQQVKIQGMGFNI